MDNQKRARPRYLFFRVESRANAETACRQGGAVLLAVGVYWTVASVFWAHNLETGLPGAVILVLGALVFKRKSRTAATLSLIIFGVVFSMAPQLLSFVAVSSPQFLFLAANCVVVFCGAR